MHWNGSINQQRRGERQGRCFLGAKRIFSLSKAGSIFSVYVWASVWTEPLKTQSEILPVYLLPAIIHSIACRLIRIRKLFSQKNILADPSRLIRGITKTSIYHRKGLSINQIWPFVSGTPSKEPNHFSAATGELIYNSTVSANQLRGATGTAIAYTPPRSIAHCKQHRA